MIGLRKALPMSLLLLSASQPVLAEAAQRVATAHDSTAEQVTSSPFDTAPGYSGGWKDDAAKFVSGVGKGQEKLAASRNTLTKCQKTFDASHDKSNYFSCLGEAAATQIEAWTIIAGAEEAVDSALVKADEDNIHQGRLIEETRKDYSQQLSKFEATIKTTREKITTLQTALSRGPLSPELEREARKIADDLLMVAASKKSINEHLAYVNQSQSELDARARNLSGARTEIAVAAVKAHNRADFYARELANLRLGVRLAIPSEDNADFERIGSALGSLNYPVDPLPMPSDGDKPVPALPIEVKHENIADLLKAALDATQ